MKILSLHIVAFGKLKDVSLQFKGGVNVIKQANSFGKTTVAGFIRAMLYGLAPARSKDTNNVSHFAPWGSADKFGGSMVVEHDGGTYRIERFFGATARQESIRIANEKTGKAVDWQKQPGEMLLGLTAESYDRSAYFPQESVELATNENLDSRLANLVQDSAENYDKVQEKLRAYKKDLRYERGLGGKIYELECAQRELGAQLAKAQNAETRAAEIDKRLADISEEHAKLTQRHAEYSQQHTMLQRGAAQAQPTDEEKRARARIAELDEKLSRIPSGFDSDFERCEQLTKEMNAPKPEQSKSPTNIGVIPIVGAIVSVVGVILAALGFTEIVPLFVGIIGVSMFAAGVVVAAVPLVHKKNMQDNRNEQLIAQYIEIASKYVYTDGVDFDTVKRTLWERHKDYQGDVRERNTLLSLVNNAHADTSHFEQDIQNVQNVLAEISQRMSELATEMGRLSEERKGLVFNSVEIMDKLLDVEQEHVACTHRYEVADAVAKLLEQAKDNLSSSYLPKLCSRCSQLIQDITQNSFSVVVDRNFTVSIREQGQTKPISEFSRGIREITLLCFRVALSELLYDGAIPFVIVDDAFVNFDEDNFVRATTLLKRLSAHAQVIYFTCHDRLGNLLK